MGEYQYLIDLRFVGLHEGHEVVHESSLCVCREERWTRIEIRMDEWKTEIDMNKSTEGRETEKDGWRGRFEEKDNKEI